MAERLPFREMIAYRPLVFAWIWETVCILGAVYIGVTTGSVPAMAGLILAGALPFIIVLMMFLRARRNGELQPRPRSIVE